MSYHYFRSHHGTPSSTRLRMIAKYSGEHRAFVTAVYWEIYDYASRNSPRGSLEGIDYEEIAFSQEVECHTVSRIVTAMCDKSFITSDNYFEIWDKEQPLREDEGASERKKQQRQREKEIKEQKLRDEEEKKHKDKNLDNYHESHDVTQCHDIQDNKQTNSIVVVKDKSLLDSPRDPEIVDNFEMDLDFNNIIVCFDVCCVLLGKEKLDELDAKALQSWHSLYDMRPIIVTIQNDLVKRMNKKLKPPNSLRFFEYVTKSMPIVKSPDIEKLFG